MSRLRRARRSDGRRNLAGPRSARRHGRRSTRLLVRAGPSRTARAARAAESVRMHHRVWLVVVAVVAMVPAGLTEHEAGEEDDRDDEHGPGGDGNVGRCLEDPRGPVDDDRLCRRRCGCGRGPHSGGFRCFTHETNDARVNSGSGYALVR